MCCGAVPLRDGAARGSEECARGEASDEGERQVKSGQLRGKFSHRDCHDKHFLSKYM